jgi:hypothetical protein
MSYTFSRSAFANSSAANKKTEFATLEKLVALLGEEMKLLQNNTLNKPTLTSAVCTDVLSLPLVQRVITAYQSEFDEKVRFENQHSESINSLQNEIKSLKIEFQSILSSLNVKIAVLETQCKEYQSFMLCEHERQVEQACTEKYFVKIEKGVQPTISNTMVDLTTEEDEDEVSKNPITLSIIEMSTQPNEDNEDFLRIQFGNVVSVPAIKKNENTHEDEDEDEDEDITMDEEIEHNNVTELQIDTLLEEEEQVLDVVVEEEQEVELEEEQVELEEEQVELEEEQVLEEEEEEDVFEIEIDDITYYATGEEDGILYEKLEDDDIGKQIGIIKNGEPIFS